MRNLLQINTGLHGEASQSSKLADEIASKLLAQHPAMQHVKRDLSKDPIPHLDQATFQGFSVPNAGSNPAQGDGVKLSDRLIAELKAADVLVVGPPMYNFTIPSTLKSWIDHVTRADHTFSFTSEGPRGLLSGKKAIIAIAQGGDFLGTSRDFQTGYLEMALGHIGITDIDFVHAKGLAMGRDEAEAGLADAYRQIATLVGHDRVPA